MVIDLDLPPGHAVFEGFYYNAMFKLITEGYTPWSPAELMDARSKLPHGHPLWNQVICTDTGIIETSEQIYLTPGSGRLRAVNQFAHIVNGGIICDAKDLGRIKKYSHDSVLLNCELTKNKAKRHPLWMDLAGGNKKRLDRYVERIFELNRNPLNLREKAMEIIFSPSIVPLEKAVALGCYKNRFYAMSWHLNFHAILIGKYLGRQNLNEYLLDENHRAA